MFFLTAVFWLSYETELAIPFSIIFYFFDTDCGWEKPFSGDRFFTDPIKGCKLPIELDY